MRKLVITSFMSTGDAEPNLNETYLVLMKDGKMYICDYELYRFWWWEKKKAVFRNRFGAGLFIFTLDRVEAFVSVYDVHNTAADSVEKFNKIYGNSKSDKED